MIRPTQREAVGAWLSDALDTEREIGRGVSAEHVAWLVSERKEIPREQKREDLAFAVARHARHVRVPGAQQVHPIGAVARPHEPTARGDAHRAREREQPLELPIIERSADRPAAGQAVDTRVAHASMVADLDQ